jgi:prepilin-type processing-associated H-X9-DG protein
VGIWWQDSSGLPDWEARSFKTSVVKDPSGTILLVEQPCDQNIVGNIWPAVSMGPTAIAQEIYQTDSALHPGGNQGFALYKLHRQRFNYLFHDNHVEALRSEATVGTGTIWSPKGMWTITPND